LIRDLLALQRLGFYQLKNKLWENLRRRPISSLGVLVIGAGFYYGYLWLSYRLVRFVYNQDVYGVLLANKLLELLLFISVGMALLSSLTTAITHFYLSKDLELHFSLPVDLNAWVLNRFSQVFMQSSWMLMLFGASFIWIFLYLSELHPLIRLAGVAIYGALCSFPIIASTLVCMILVRLFPARRVHQVFLVVTVVLVSSVILIFRYLEPEQYIGPGGLERFRGFVDLTANRRQPWNPAMWAADLFAAWNQKQWSASLEPGLKLGALFAVGIGGLLVTAQRVYRGSWDRALQALSGETDLLQRGTKLSWLSRHLASARWSQEVRELLLFIRDPSQWSQVFVLGALMALYLFSVSKVTDNLLGATSYIMALLNSLFVGFISLSIASRFVFTSFSSDGEAIWLMKTAPDGWSRFMRGKLIVYGIPCLVFSILLGVLSGVILGLDREQLVTLGFHGLWDGSLMILLSLAFGMLFINPGIENPLKLIISPGGLLLMVVGVFFSAAHLVLRLTANMPALNRFLAEYGWPDMSGGRGEVIIAWVIAVESIGIALLVKRGMRHLRAGLFVS